VIAVLAALRQSVNPSIRQSVNPSIRQSRSANSAISQSANDCGNRFNPPIQSGNALDSAIRQ